jgi:hypothetical protein
MNANHDYMRQSFRAENESALPDYLEVRNTPRARRLLAQATARRRVKDFTARGRTDANGTRLTTAAKTSSYS